MPVQTIRDPKTGEERKVYVLPTGMGADAEAPKPQPKPQAPGGFLGTINDLNPIKQISALGSGVSTFLQTGDLNKGIAAAQKESMATTGLGRSVERVGRVGAQRAVDAARYEVDRARLAREQIAAGTAPMDVKIPSTGPEAPSAQRVRLPQWMGYDGIQEQPKNLVEDFAASAIALLPYFAAASKGGAPANALMRMLPGVGKVATGFEAATTGLKAAGGLKKVAGVFAEEAVSGAIPSMIATYYAQKPTDKTLSDALSDAAKGGFFEGIVAKGLLIDPNDTVEQARIKQSINDAVWSVPLGGSLGTGFRGIGAMAGATKRALAEVLHGTVKVGQADVAMKEAVEAATTGAPAAAAAPGAPAPTAAPAPRVVSGKQTFSSQTYQGLRRQPMWEKTGVETQGTLEPQAAPAPRVPQTLPVEAWAPRLNYSDINPGASPVPTASGKRYAEALAGQDQVAVEATSQRVRASFNNAAAKLGIELGPNAGSQSWSMWDIGKQLYMNANPAKSNKPYVLGNPLDNVQVQSDIVDRMLGFELTKGVDAEGKRWKSWQLTQIGRKAREDAGIELGLFPDRGPQQPRSAPLTPQVAAARLQQAQADLVTSTQRLQTEAAREMVTAPEAAAAPQGQLPGMSQPAYEQTGAMATADIAVAPKVFQYKAEGQFSATGQSGSLAQENVYDPVYAGVVAVWRDKLGELGPVGQVYIINGHNRYDLALRSGAQFMNVQFIDTPTAAEARVVAALQNIKDDKGTAIDAGKLFRDTGMSIEDLRRQNVTLNGKLAAEGIALGRLPQWLFDKAATGDLATSVAVALGSAGDIDQAIISDVAKQAIKGKWSADKIAQAMQEAKFASAGAGPTEGVLPGFEEMFKSTDVVALIDVRTAAYRALSVEMRALAAASKGRNTQYLEAAGNVIDVEGSQTARRLAAESVAVFNRVTGYEGPVRTILNELAAQLPGGKNQEKAAANLVQFNLQQLRDAISEEMHGPKLPMAQSVPSAGTPAAAPAPAKAELPDTRGQGQFFHGAAAEIKQLGEGYYTSGNVYGQGFYTTDDVKTAGSYTKKNVRSVAKSGGTPGQVIYQAVEREPVKFYDLDAPVSPSARQELERVSDRSESVALALDEFDGDPSLAELMDEIRAGSKGVGESADTIQEIFEGLRETLQAEGYGGFTHVGGKLTKAGREHQVKIYWNPETQLELKRYEAPAAPTTVITPEVMPKAKGPRLSEAMGRDFNALGQSLGRLTRAVDENFQAQERSLQRREEAIARELGAAAVPENAGNPAPIQAAPAAPALRAAPDPAENRAIATALEAHDRAIETGDTQAAGDIGAWVERRGVKPVAEPRIAVQPMGNVAAAAIEPPGPAGMARAKAANLPASAVRAASTPGLVKAAANRLVDMGIARNLDEAMARAEDAGVLTDAGALLKLFSGNDDELKGAQLQLQRMGSATWGNEIDQPPVAKLRAAMEAIYPPPGSRGADFSAELPDLSGWTSVETGVGGTVGEGYTGATKITEQEASELARIAYRITGITDFEIQSRIEATYTEKQARAYGDMSLVGKAVELNGSYKYGKRMADDTITVAMSAYGKNLSFTQALSATYHESMHRLMRWFFTSKENLVLSRSEKSLREMAALTAESFGRAGKATKYRDGTIGMGEVVPDAFAAYARGITLPNVDLQGFAKLKNYIDESINFLLSGGKYKTWDDVFEKAALGEIKDRGPVGGTDDGVQFAADPPDPAEFARRIDQNMQALESGQLEPEEIARMGASDVRRITSRSGNTQYVPDAPNELIASNRALGEMLTSRAQQTGIESYSPPAIVKAALDQLDRDGWAVESTVTRLEAARSGDPKSQDDLVALAANVIHRDYLAAQNGMTAIEWQSAVDDGDRAVSMQRLWAGLEDQHKLDTALMTATRKDGQRLSVMQIRHQIDPTHRTLPTGTVLYHGTSQSAGQAIIDTGFRASSARSNLLGSGIYFADDLNYAGAYGEVAAGGDVPSDIRILDMVAMDRRIADLVQELNLGPLQKRGGELYMTEAQKVGVRDWATGQGYSGIRFSPDFEMREGAAPETVIYDVNVANRIVGSKAAVEPEVPRSNESMATDIENEIADPVNTILGKLDPEIRADIEEGNLTPEVVGLTDTLSRLSVEGRDNPGHRAKFNSMVKRVDVNRLNQEMVGQMFISSLLWSVGTPAKMLLGSAYRATTMPLNQAIGELGIAGVSAIKGNKAGAARALQKAGLDMQMYGKMVTNLSNTFRLVGHSLKEGEAFGNLGVTSQELVRRKLTPGDKQMSMFTDPEDPANTLDNPWWLDPENKNIPALAVRFAWQALNTSSRVAGSIDTLFSSMMGPSAEWSRMMDLELNKAYDRGLTGQDAWVTASAIVDDRLEMQWVDVAINGRMIQNGAFTGVHAKNAMDWINYTDPLEVDFQPRSYEYGVIKAKEEGLTDVAEINKRAMAWVEEEPPAMAKLGMGVGRAVTLPAKLLKDAVGHVPVLRILHSFPTSPVNIGKASMRGYGFTAPFVDTFWRDIYSEDRGTRSRVIGEWAVAQITLAFGTLLANSGFVEFSGPGTYNSQVRDKMNRLGIEPYSIRFKNPYNGWKSKWWNLQAFDTTSNMFAIIGLLQNTANSIPKEDLEALTSNMILGYMEFGRQVGFAQFSKDMNRSLGEIANLISDLQNRSFIPVEGQIDPYSSYIERRLSGFMPSIFNVARKGADPYQRAIEKSTLPQPIAFIHELGQRLANRVPGLSGTLPPILHPLTAEPMLVSGTWGLEFIPADQPWLRAMINAASPLGFTTGKAGSDDPVDIELGRLSGRGAQFQIWSPREFSEVANYRLNQVQLNKLAVLTSQFVPPGRSATLHQSLSAMVAPTSSYWQLPVRDPSKVTASNRVIRINKEIDYYKPFIREAFLATEPRLANMLAEKKRGSAQAEYEATYGVGSPWSPTPQ
jgi:hypothetical protein